jgi:hypothetical protein
MTPLFAIGLLTVLSTFVASWLGPRVQANAILMMMAGNSMFGAKVCDYPFGMVSNVTNAPYAAVVTLIAIMGFRHGSHFASLMMARSSGGWQSGS